MITNNLLSSIISQTFQKEVGKHQANKGKKALKVSFALSVDSEKEEGYRHLDILIYAPQNYVGVYVRRRWDVIAIEDMEYDDEGDGCPKPGKDYTKEATAWERMSFHDSGWTEGVGSILRTFESQIIGTSGKHWYEVVEVPVEIL